MAQQTDPVRRQVALKVIKAGMDSKLVVARFEAERQALALMDHPNIARVLDGGTTSTGRPYFVMDLVKGVPITKYCDDHHLTPRERLELFVPVCQAVQHAHQKGIIHRDLKPSNVVVALYDGKPVPKVIDFGVAKAAGQPLTDKTLVTGFGSIVGTLEYMSPEQAEVNQLDIDTRSDIYSLGVLLYELLAGSPPFSRRDLEKAGMLEMLRVIREQEPSKPSVKLSTAEGLPTLAANRATEPAKLTKLLRGDLDWIVMKALEKDRNRRYATANSFALDVQRYLNDEHVSACPPSTIYSLKKFLKRNRAAVLATCAVFLALIGGIVGVVWSLIEARQQRDAASASAAAERNAKETAQAVLEFVENKVFSAARPEGQEGGLGKDVTLREAIEAALPYVDTSFPDRPLIEARLRMTIGNSFWLLGDPRARPQYERARDILTAHYGPDHPETLNSIEGLWNGNGLLGNFDECVPIAEDLLRRRKASLGPDHLDTLKTMSLLARSYQLVARHSDALTMREEVLQRLRANYPDDFATLSAMANLAESYRIHWRHAESLKLDEEAFRLRRLKQGSEHPVTLRHSVLLAADYMATGRRADALQLLNHVNGLQTAKLGPDHIHTLESLRYLALGYSTDGQEGQALKLWEEVLRRRKAKYGLDNVRTLQSVHDVSAGYFVAGRHAEALELRREALRLQKARVGPDHPDTLWSTWAVAASLTALNRDEEATPLVEDCLKRAANKHVDLRLVPELLRLRLRLFAKKKDIANCLATALRLDELKAPNPFGLYMSACGRALCAAVITEANPGVANAGPRSQEQADLGMARLTTSIADGFYELVWIKREKDLNPLRERPDFKDLVAKLEKRIVTTP
jgi:serine/threonine protein kinase